MIERLPAALGAVAAAFLGAGILSGLDRRLTARLQSRVGPPLLQPFFDLLKLASKTPMAANGAIGACAAVCLLAAVSALALFFLGVNLLLVVFVQAVGGVFLVLGAMSVDSPYSRVGAQRELLQMLACEPLVLLAVIGLGRAGGGFGLHDVLSAPGPLLLRLPLLFPALTLALTIRLRKSPLDIAASHHAHQELVRGVYTEYSGRHLALVEAAHWLETSLLLALLWLFCVRPWWAGALLVAAVYAAEIFVDNLCARLTWGFLLALAWGLGLALCVANLAWLALA